jgi:MFS transporter, ACS family, tartrate transporter
MASAERDVRDQARRHIATRLLLAIFILYLISMIDRFNVSYAALRMNADLRFSDSVYGFGASVFFITYALLEIPGAVVNAGAFANGRRALWFVGVHYHNHRVHSQCSRVLLCEAIARRGRSQLLPGYGCLSDALVYAQGSGASHCSFLLGLFGDAFIGAGIAGWLLPVHRLGMSGWRWLFIVEGAPAVVAGVIVLFYLTDRPSEAKCSLRVNAPASRANSRPIAPLVGNIHNWHSGMPAKIHG